MYTKLSNISLEQFNLLYIKQQKSQIQTAKIIGCSPLTLNRFMKLHNILPHKIKRKEKKYDIDDNYFNFIDTEHKAYFLGLMFADGNVHKQSNGMSINLIIDDIYLLQEFRKQLKSNNPINIIKFNNNWKSQANFRFYSYKLREDLINIGCVPKKSKILSFPNTKLFYNNTFNHFLRGYFDGDGCVCKKSYSLYVSITSSKLFCEHCASYLKDSGIDCYSRKHSKNSDCYVILIKCNKKNLHNFYKLIYTNASIFMIRKKERFDNHLFA